MKRIAALLLFPVLAYSQPPYDVTVNFSAVAGADSYNFYIDDCDIAGPVGAPAGTMAAPPETFTAILVADGTYLMCVRAENGAGIQPNPGQVVQVEVNDLPLPGPVDDLAITVQCPLGSCTVNITVQ